MVRTYCIEMAPPGSSPGALGFLEIVRDFLGTRRVLHVSLDGERRRREGSVLERSHGIMEGRVATGGVTTGARRTLAVAPIRAHRTPGCSTTGSC